MTEKKLVSISLMSFIWLFIYTFLPLGLFSGLLVL